MCRAVAAQRGNVTVIVVVVVASDRRQVPSTFSGHVQSMRHAVKASLRRPLPSSGPCASIDARSSAAVVPAMS